MNNRRLSMFKIENSSAVKNIIFLISMTLIATLDTSCTLRKRNPPPKEDATKKNEEDAKNKADENKDKKTETNETKESEAKPQKPSEAQKPNGNPKPQTSNTTQEKSDLDALHHPLNPFNQNKKNLTPAIRRKRLTGAQQEIESLDEENKTHLKVDLAYTDSSSDDLIETLRTQLNAKINNNSALKRLAYDFANSISDVKILNKKDSTVTVEVHTSEIKNENTQSVSTILLKGSQKKNSRTIILQNYSEENKRYQGSLKCLDKNTYYTCSTYILTVSKIVDQLEVPASIIIRNTQAKFEVLAASDSTTEDSTIQELFTLLQSEDKKDNHILPRYSIIQSFSVIGGKAQFQLHLSTPNGEFINLEGPLLTSIGNKTSMKIPLSKNPQFIVPLTTQARDKQETEELSSVLDMGSFFESAFLKSNDGRGKIVIDLVGAPRSKEVLTIQISNTRLPLTNMDSESKDQ